ncbi:hypothetical protein MPL1032_20413 [Mesorhizobium plurifarium]|uniref:Uncharacterized protein n=1 Tax=Mesorhizobium plurifarium TaxID=69974 RepID=A0A0K2VWW4_MESPL|nr:hypothetical protein MPL1032_20413 [Mesorhizobium plurifarium]
MTKERKKFRNTTTWLREARERFDGGGVPASGRNASAAVFGTIGPFAPCRPNSPSLGLVFMTPCRLILQRIPRRKARGEFGKNDGSWRTTD